MDTRTPTRPKLKQVMTATAFSLVQIRAAWKQYFRALAAERREAAAQQRRGWGG